MHTDISAPDRRRFLAGLAASLLLAGCSRRPVASADSRVSYYTCAMHPSVRSHDPKGHCPICGMDLVPIYRDTAANDGPTRPFTLAPEQAKLLGVASAPLALREATRPLRAAGQAAPGGAVGSFFEEDAPPVARGQAASVTFDAAPDAAFPGKVVSLGAVDPVSHRREVKITLGQANFRPGLPCAVTVSVPLGKRLVAPLSAVMPTGRRHVVLVDRGGGTIEPRYVEVGEELPEGWEIVSGAKEGERLVTSANYLVEAQARIEGALKGWGESR